MELQLDGAVSKLKGVAFAEMVSDDTIRRAMASDTYSVSVSGAKVAIYDKYLCPVFGNAYGAHESRCYYALYASGGDGTGGNYWYDRAGIPGKLASVVADFRNTMLEKARAALRNPQALWDFYEAKKLAALSAFFYMDRAKQNETRADLLKAREGFKRLGDPVVQEAVNASVAAERAWLADKTESNEHMAKFNAYAQKAREVASLSDGDPYWVMFAHRRLTEGGPELVKTWLRIIDDLIAATI